MSYTATATRTSTTTTTEARVRYVMQKVMANLYGLVVRGLLTQAGATKWSDDLIYLQLEDALDFFEVQIGEVGADQCGLRYRVSNDGTLQQDASSGGLDLYGIPAGTPVRLYAHTYPSMRERVRPELERRGWGFSGKKLEAPESESRAFSSGGYGITRSKLGNWP